jgi:hypothetical protein
MGTHVFALMIAVAAPLVLMGQPKPPSEGCDVPEDAPMARVTGSKPAELWNSVLSVKFSVPAGHPVSTGKRNGDWTCVSYYGSGNGWMLSSRLEAIQPDLHPPASAWMGTWVPLGVKKQPREGVTKLTISAGAAAGSVKVEGQAYWFGAVVHGERVEHEGSVGGEARPHENRLHIADGGCEVDMALIGGFLNVRDNRGCGGMNVTFTGVWEKGK